MAQNLKYIGFRNLVYATYLNMTVELRKFINNYLNANKDILKEFEAQQKQKKEEWLNDEN